MFSNGNSIYVCYLLDISIINYIFRSDIIMKYKDISGQQFGRLTALYRLHNYHKKGTYWLCVCDCGNLTEVRYDALYNGNPKSCGCYRKERIKNLKTRHGKSYIPLYYVWNNIKQRCHNSNCKNYKNYGGRGIAVCDKWKDNFQAFYDWALNNGYSDNLTIDRIDVNGNYEPNNCRFVNMKQQERNKRNNRNITINGEMHCLKEWCELLGLNYQTVFTRIYRGWSIERALELEEK